MQKRRGSLTTAATNPVIGRIAMPLFSLAQYPPLNKWLAATVLMRKMTGGRSDA